MTEPEKPIRRRVRLIKPALQLKLCLVFVCVGLACILVQFTLWSGTLTDLSNRDPGVTDLLLPSLWKHLGITVFLLVPLMLSVGIIVTHRVAGPVYRFEQYLGDLAAGQDPGHCRIRKGDELGDLCAIVNTVAERVRCLEAQIEEQGGSASSSESPSEETASPEQNEEKNVTS